MATFQQFIAQQGIQFTTGYLNLQYQDTLTAHSGGGSASALPLLAQINRVTTVAAAGDSVALPTLLEVSPQFITQGPPDRRGCVVYVINSGANVLAVFPAVGETMNGTTNGSVSLGVNSIGTFYCTTDGAWITADGGVITFGITTPQVLAAAGATQGNASQITKQRVSVTTTTSAEGVKLPVAATGMAVTVGILGTKGVKVYPATNGKLDASSTNVAVLLVAGKVNTYYALSTTQWITFKGA